MTTTTRVTTWAFPGSRLVLRADAPRPAWLRERMNGIGGSDVSKVLGFTQHGSAYSVWLEKTGRKVGEQEANMRMKMGVLMEPVLKELFSEETGLKVRSAGLHRSREHPHMQVTIDGATEDGGIIECKTTNKYLRHEWEDDQIPDHAELQIQHGLAVTGRSHGWCVGLIDGYDLIIRRVERDQVLIDNLIQLETDYWFNHIVADVEPPVTAYALPAVMERYRDEVAQSEVELDAEAVLPLIDRIKQLKDLAKKVEADEALAQAELRNLAGPAELVKVDGLIVATLKSTGTFASSKFVTDHPDTAAEYMVKKEVVDAQRLAAEKPDLYNHYRSRVLRFPAPPKKKEK